MSSKSYDRIRPQNSHAREPSWMAATTSLARLLVMVICSTALCVVLDARLPDPLSSVHTEAGLDKPEIFSEKLALDHLNVIARDIGLRPTGTLAEQKCRQYITEMLYEYKRKAINPYIAQFDIEVQDSFGSHETVMAKETALKRGVKNVVARISWDNEGKNSVLMNTHYDSTVSTTGAGDSAVAAAAMLELVRVYTQGSYKLKNTLVLVWNGAEETLFDGAYSFYSQHEYAKEALINMDAIGTTGGEVLFQINSDLMLHAYSGVPHPTGSTFCNDFFNSGLITSNTDFSTFVSLDDNLIAMDLALYNNTYFYHTLLDTPKNVGTGTLQNLGDNILHISKYLLEVDNLDKFKPGVSYFYYAFYKLRFFMIKWPHLVLVTVAACLFNLYCVHKLLMKSRHCFFISSMQAFQVQLNAIMFYFASLVGGSVSMVLFSAINCYIFNKPMLWYYPEGVIIVLSIPSFLLGSFAAQYLHLKTLMNYINKYQSKLGCDMNILPKNEELNEEKTYLEDNSQNSNKDVDGKHTTCRVSIGEIDVHNSTGYSDVCYSPKTKLASEDQLSYFAGALTISGSSSALAVLSVILSLCHQGYVQFTLSTSFFSTLALFYKITRPDFLKFNAEKYSVIPEIIALLSLPFVVSEIRSFTKLLVPVSSIAGAYTHIDVVLFALLAAILHFPMSTLYPLAHFPNVSIKKKRNILLISSVVLLIFNFVFGIFKMPYDAIHPRRIYLAHIFHQNNNKNSLIVAFSDYGHSEHIVSDISGTFELTNGRLFDNNENHDTMLLFHPFRKFLKVYEFDVSNLGVLGLSSPQDTSDPMLEVKDDSYEIDDLTGLITCKLSIHHRGLINLVVQVDADVHSWSSHPGFKKSLSPNRRKKYVYNDASGYGTEVSELSFVYKTDRKNPPSIVVSGSVARVFSQTREIEFHGKAQSVLNIVDDDHYSHMYHRLSASLFDWITPLIGSARILEYKLKNSVDTP